MARRRGSVARPTSSTPRQDAEPTLPTTGAVARPSAPTTRLGAFLTEHHVDTKLHIVDRVANLAFGSDASELSAARMVGGKGFARTNPRSGELELSFADACGIIADAVADTEFAPFLVCEIDRTTNRLRRNANGMLSLRDAFDAADIDGNKRLSVDEVDAALDQLRLSGQQRATTAASRTTTRAVARNAVAREEQQNEEQQQELEDDSFVYSVYGTKTRVREANAFCAAGRETIDCELRCFQPLPYPPPPAAPSPPPMPPPPMPPPPEDDVGGLMECFPGSATVTLQDGTVRAMRDLRVGDQVAVSSPTSAAGGPVAFEPVLSLSHADPKALASFLTLTLEGTSKNITLTPGHLVHVQKSGGIGQSWANPVEASRIEPGDRLLVHEGDRLEPRRVAAVERAVEREGLFNPHTQSGTIVVDGVLASCYTAGVDVRVADALLFPAHALARGLLLPLRSLILGAG